MNVLKKKKKARKEKILKTALELFNERGFEEVKIRDIAARAELAVGTLYNYFSSKDHLILSILESKLEVEEIEVYFKNDSWIRTRDFASNLISLLEKYYDVISEYDKDILITLFSIIFSSKSYTDQAKKMDYDMIEKVQKIVIKAQKRGIILKKVVTFDLTMVLYGIIFNSILMYVYMDEYSDKQIRRSMRNQIKIVLSGNMKEGE